MGLVRELAKELGMVNVKSLTSGSIAGLGAWGGGWHELAEVGGFWKVTEGGGLVRRSWVDGSEERIWKPSLRIRLRRWGPG